MPVNLDNPNDLDGATVLGASDDKLGKVQDVYFDNETSRPEWVSVKTGMFGGNVALVPLSQADFDGQDLRVPYSKDQMKSAPHHDPGQDLSPSDEQDLYRHYQMDYTPTRTGNGDDGDRRQDRAGESGVQGRDTSGPTTDEAMTRSEEQLHVGTEQQETGKARLRKHIVTETETVQVPVSREEVRVEREPITEANRGQAMAGGDLTEEEHEVTLTEERAVVTKEAVPVERVRLGTETVTDEQTVTEEVRKEQIDADTGETTPRR